jgi:hypothetical protein
MRRTKNITTAISERTYNEARVYAVQRQTSVSALVQFLLENLPLLSRAIHRLIEENPNFGGSEPARPPHKRRQG